MYQETTFKFRAFIKTDVHRQVHHDNRWRKIVTIEGIDVCVQAWMHVAGVPEATFYRYQGYANEGRQALPFGNTGLVKTRKHTAQATATMRCILESTADHMPHCSRTLKSREKVAFRILLASFNWKDVISKVNEANSAFGLKEVSTSNLSKIRSRIFFEFDKKRHGENFARCSTCDKFNSLLKGAIATTQQVMKYALKLQKHLANARAHRELYYANHYCSHTYPHEILTVMHDKMDHAKTASPVFSHKSKDLDGLIKLLVSVTGMIAHGHGDVRYAHYRLDLFSHDSNYTIGSMAKLLQDLELPPKTSLRELFMGSKSLPLFDAVLFGAEMCERSLLPRLENLVPAVALPPILQVYMDNATRDNKNRFVFYFWSLLVAKKIFREVFVNFMIVGHTHDNIDALFGRWSMLLKKKNYSTIPALMKSFMDLESILVIPHLIEEVPNFKGFIAGKYHDGDETLIDHTRPQQMKFYLDSNGCPVMKYKLLCSDPEWLGEDGKNIKLWKEDSEGRSPWPRGIPQAVTQSPMRNMDDIQKGLSGFQRYWENMCNEDVTGEFKRQHKHLVQYWRAVKEALLEPVPISTILKDGFWPSSWVEAVMADQIADNGKDIEDFGEDNAYVGPLRGRPLPSFRVGRDLYEGYFVAVRPSDGDTRPVWIARALSNPNSNPEKPNCVQIQYFRPTSQDQDIQDNYTGWDDARGLRWKIDESKPPLWEETIALMTAWRSRIKRGTIECMIKIPTAQIQVINKSLALYNLLE